MTLRRLGLRRVLQLVRQFEGLPPSFVAPLHIAQAVTHQGWSWPTHAEQRRWLSEQTGAGGPPGVGKGTLLFSVRVCMYM